MKTDPWKNGTLFRSTAEAQKAFNARAGSFTEEQKENGSKYHDYVAAGEDDARVNSIEGDVDEVCAWYWEDSLKATR